MRAEEITQEAELRAEERLAEVNAEIQGRIGESRRFSEQQMAAADDYALELLARLDQQLEAFRQSVRAGLDQLEAPPAAGEAPAEGRREGSRRAMPATPAGGAGNGNGNGNGNGHGRGHAPARERSRSALGTLMGPDAEAAADGEPHVTDEGVIDDFAMPALDDQPGAVADLPPELRGEAAEDDSGQHRLHL